MDGQRSALLHSSGKGRSPRSLDAYTITITEPRVLPSSGHENSPCSEYRGSADGTHCRPRYEQSLHAKNRATIPHRSVNSATNTNECMTYINLIWLIHPHETMAGMLFTCDAEAHRTSVEVRAVQAFLSCPAVESKSNLAKMWITYITITAYPRITEIAVCGVHSRFQCFG